MQLISLANRVVVEKWWSDSTEFGCVGRVKRDAIRPLRSN